MASISRRELLWGIGALGVAVGTRASSNAETLARVARRSRVIWPDDLIAFWDFAEASAPYSSVAGIRRFDLEDGGNGTVMSDPDCRGPFGPSAAIGGDSWLKVPEDSVRELNVGLSSCQVTVVAWVSRRQNSDGSCIAGMWRETGSNPARQYALWLDLAVYGGDSKVSGHVSKSGGPSPGLPWSRDYSSSRRQLPDNEMRFVAFTYDGAMAVSYLDGVADSYENYTEPGPPNGQSLTYDKNPYLYSSGLNSVPTDFTVGTAAPETGRANFDGTVGGLAVFDRALSPAELMQIHSSTLKPGAVVLTCDFTRPKITRPGTKVSMSTLGMRQIRGASGSTKATPAQTFYGQQDENGPPFIAYDCAVATTNATTEAMAYADYPTSLQFSRIKSISCTILNSSPSILHRFTIRIDGRWYATADTFHSATGHSADTDWGSADTVEFDCSAEASEWRELSAVAGSKLSMGPAVIGDLEDGQLTGYGIFCSSGVGTDGHLRVSSLDLRV